METEIVEAQPQPDDSPPPTPPKECSPTLEIRGAVRSAEIGLFAAALAKAQGQYQPAIKDKLNPHFSSRYADLAAVWEACRPALADAQIAVVQVPSNEGGSIRVTTMMIHSSGQFVQGEFEVRAGQNTPQGVGSALTYARRYAFAAMVGVVPDDDDDGEAAEPQKIQKKAPGETSTTGKNYKNIQIGEPVKVAKGTPAPAPAPAAEESSADPEPEKVQKKRAKVLKLLRQIFTADEDIKTWLNGAELKTSSLETCNQWIGELEARLQEEA